MRIWSTATATLGGDLRDANYLGEQRQPRARIRRDHGLENLHAALGQGPRRHHDRRPFHTIDAQPASGHRVPLQRRVTVPEKKQ